MAFTYNEAVQHLLWLGHEGRTLKWDLNNIRAVLAALGHPEAAWPSVHIAGTNGKGSVAAMLDSILRVACYRTGLYTSPHLVRINERIQVNGIEISDAEFALAFSAAERAIEGLLAEGTLPAHPSFFETLTAIAFWHFREVGVDFAVLEVGMGGRLDATNVVTPRVSVITQVDFDHERFLGHSLAQIATEKTGIIKPGVPVVSSAERPEAHEVIRQRTAELAAPLVEIDSAYRIENLRSIDLGRYEFDVAAEDGFRLHLAPSLRGRVQIRNAVTAVATARLLAAQGFRLTPEAIARGIAETRWPGRLEQAASTPDLFLDGAHNPAACRELLRFWDEHLPSRKIHLIFGAMRDKALDEIADRLFHRPASVIVTQIGSPRAASGATLARLAEALNPKVFVEPDAEHALARAYSLAGPADVIFVAGSFYLVGEVKKALASRRPLPVPTPQPTPAGVPAGNPA